jgi:hypothetical protein
MPDSRLLPAPIARSRSSNNVGFERRFLGSAIGHLGIVLLLGLALPASSSAAPRSVVADYQVTYNGFSATGRLRVAPHAAGRWLVSLRFGNLLASLEQATVFDIVQDHVRPLGTSRVVNTPLSRRTITTRFDWREAQATWKGDAKPGHRGPVPLQAGDVDPLLFQLAIVDNVGTGRSTRYRVLDNGRAHVLAYRPLHAERLRQGGRTYLTSKLFATEGNKRYVVWVAPGIPVPVRMLQSEVGGDTIDLRLTALR